MTMLSELVDVVIGVDTHTDTHTAAVLAVSGAVLAESTEHADPDGYAALVALADRHGRSRAWAIESANGYGAGLARFLAELGEWVIEIDRPNRSARRHGAKSDPIDGVRAAREALSRARLAVPRCGAQRGALSVRLTARRSAIDASGEGVRSFVYEALDRSQAEPVSEGKASWERFARSCLMSCSLITRVARISSVRMG